jgi:hypothetical protein
MSWRNNYQFPETHMLETLSIWAAGVCLVPTSLFLPPPCPARPAQGSAHGHPSPGPRTRCSPALTPAPMPPSPGPSSHHFSTSLAGQCFLPRGPEAHRCHTPSSSMENIFRLTSRSPSVILWHGHGLGIRAQFQGSLVSSVLPCFSLFGESLGSFSVSSDKLGKLQR